MKEETLMGGTVLATLAIVTAALYLAGEYAVAVSIVVVFLILLALIAWERVTRKGKKEGHEKSDERTALCSLRAARNGLLVSMALAAILSLVAVTGTGMSMFSAISWIYMWGVGTFSLSYLYYNRLA